MRRPPSDGCEWLTAGRSAGGAPCFSRPFREPGPTFAIMAETPQRVVFISRRCPGSTESVRSAGMRLSLVGDPADCRGNSDVDLVTDHDAGRPDAEDAAI
jgi:hypothetical protein